MNSIQKILVAVDGSACSDAALLYARKLALQAGAELELVHVWTPPMPIGPMVNQLTMIDPLDGKKKPIGAFGQREGESVIVAARKLLSQHGLDNVHATLQPGMTVEVVLDTIKARKADLLVVGTHGHEGLKRLMLGSVAAQLVRLSPIPIITLRAAEAD